MSAVIEIPRNYSARPHRLSVEMYDSMIRNGILNENDNVELLDGIIIEKMAKGKKHAYFTDALSDLLRDQFGDRAVVRNQNPILLGDFSEPEPDIVLCKGPREKYLSNHPEPSDVLLLIEVSETTLYFDRIEKGLAYSIAGISQYLIVNLENDTIEEYLDPSEDGYQTKRTFRSGETFGIIAFPEVEIDIASLLKS